MDLLIINVALKCIIGVNIVKMYFAPESSLIHVSFHYKGFGNRNLGETELKCRASSRPKSLPWFKHSVAKKPVDSVQYNLLEWKKSLDLWSCIFVGCISIMLLKAHCLLFWHKSLFCPTCLQKTCKMRLISYSRIDIISFAKRSSADRSCSTMVMLHVKK